MTTGAVSVQVEASRHALLAARQGLAAEVAWQLSEPELLEVCTALARLRSGVESTYLAAVAEVDRRRAAAPARGSDGPRGSASGIGSSTEQLLRTGAPLTPTQARADVEAARALSPGEPLHELDAQLVAGDITRAHVDVAVRCLARIPAHLSTSDEDRATIRTHVVALAPTSHARDLQRAASALLEVLAPDVADRFDPRAHERRFLDVSTDLTGMLVGRFALDAAAGATLQAALEQGSAPRPADDGGHDRRTATERRADALVAIADRALSVAQPSRGERPRVVVHTTVDQLARVRAAGPARTEAGADLDPEALRRLSCDAVLQRVVWDRHGDLLPSERLDLGRAARLADVHVRRALAARDRGCVVPGCGARPAHCDAHHVVHWADGGSTDLGNLVLLCGSHHSAVHAGTWRVSVAADGIPVVVPPDRVDPRRRPRRAPHHDADALLEALTIRRGRTAAGPVPEPGPGPGPGFRPAEPGHGDGASVPGDPAPVPAAGRARVELDDWFTRVDDAERTAAGPPRPRRRRRDDGWLPPGWDPHGPPPF